MWFLCGAAANPPSRKNPWQVRCAPGVVVVYKPREGVIVVWSMASLLRSHLCLCDHLPVTCGRGFFIFAPHLLRIWFPSIVQNPNLAPGSIAAFVNGCAVSDTWLRLWTWIPTNFILTSVGRSGTSKITFFYLCCATDNPKGHYERNRQIYKSDYFVFFLIRL